MSNIDLSKAKIGDKFINKEGEVLELIKFFSGCKYNYVLKSERGLRYSVTNDGSFVEGEENPLDLVVQVFDESLDTKERDIRTNNEMRKVVEMADEEKQELQRRKEVIELAEKMYIMFENEMLRYNLERNGISTYSSERFRDSAIIRAASFINKKHQYLKDGKL
jgi:hypothetical protein